MKRNLIIFVVALPFIISFAFLIATQRPAPLPDTPLPNPNGYDQFIKAAGMLQGEADQYETMSEADLAALVATNAEALALAHSAFNNECRVPVQYSASYVSTHLNDLRAFRKLAQTMAAEGRQAELKSHPAQAAQDYLDVIHFGEESGRGGFMLNALVGIAIEKIGLSRLENLLNGLDASSCRTTAATLELLDSHRQNWDDILQHHITRGLFAYLTAAAFMRESKNNAEKKFHDQQGQTRNLAVKFAARAYELDKGKPPTNITDLVPAYLKAVPQDPTTGKDMVLSSAINHTVNSSIVQTLCSFADPS